MAMLLTRKLKNLSLRQSPIVDPDIVDCANPVASPSIRADKQGGRAADNSTMETVAGTVIGIVLKYIIRNQTLGVRINRPRLIQTNVVNVYRT
jgi:hypothetical protein